MKPACRHYRRCSGCTKLQLPYAKQVHDKDRSVRAELGRFVGGPDAPAFEPCEPSPRPLAYRTSTKLCLSEDNFGQRSIGLYERGTKTVVGIPDCPVHDPIINRLVARLFDPRTPLPAPFYNHARKGFQPERLKFVTIRVGLDGAGVVLSHTGVPRPALAAWAERLATPQLCIYEAPLTRADEDRILSDAASHLAGPPACRVSIAGRAFELSPLAFFQANLSLTEAFVGHVAAGLAGDTLLDLYGGFGAYTFAAGPRFRRAWLVDTNPSAIVAANTANAAVPLPGFASTQASVEDFLAHLAPEDARTVTSVIVNPPRAGLSPKAKARLSRTALPALAQLVYVSCNPDSLKRDLDELTRRGGLKVTSIKPFDMFPQTGHVEVVARLTAPRR